MPRTSSLIRLQIAIGSESNMSSSFPNFYVKKILSYDILSRFNSIWIKLLTTFFAGYAVPYGVKLVGGSIQQSRSVGQNARFEIADRCVSYRTQHRPDLPNQCKRPRNQRSISKCTRGHNLRSCRFHSNKYLSSSAKSPPALWHESTAPRRSNPSSTFSNGAESLRFFT